MPNRIIKWIDQRFPLTSFVKHELTGYPTPRNLSYWWNFGFLAGFVLVLQVAITMHEIHGRTVLALGHLGGHA